MISAEIAAPMTNAIDCFVLTFGDSLRKSPVVRRTRCESCFRRILTPSGPAPVQFEAVQPILFRHGPASFFELFPVGRVLPRNAIFGKRRPGGPAATLTYRQPATR